MTYVIIGNDIYFADTAVEIEEAKAAMVDAGITECPVYVGDPESEDTTYRNGQVLFA